MRQSSTKNFNWSGLVGFLTVLLFLNLLYFYLHKGDSTNSKSGKDEGKLEIEKALCEQMIKVTLQDMKKLRESIKGSENQNNFQADATQKLKHLQQQIKNLLKDQQEDLMREIQKEEAQSKVKNPKKQRSDSKPKSRGRFPPLGERKKLSSGQLTTDFVKLSSEVLGWDSWEIIAKKFDSERYALHNLQHSYEGLLTPIRVRGRIRFLEIGLGPGKDLNLWRNYFPHAYIVGIVPQPPALPANDRFFKQYVGDQTNATFLKEVMEQEKEGFDLIIDNGGHTYSQQQSSFDYLFLHGLKDGGLYIIEDIETSYWSKTEGGHQWAGGRGANSTTIEWSKKFVDVVNGDYYDIDNLYRMGSPGDRHVRSVFFGSNVVAFFKFNGELSRMGVPRKM